MLHWQEAAVQGDNEIAGARSFNPPAALSPAICLVTSIIFPKCSQLLHGKGQAGAPHTLSQNLQATVLPSGVSASPRKRDIKLLIKPEQVAYVLSDVM